MNTEKLLGQFCFTSHRVHFAVGSLSNFFLTKVSLSNFQLLRKINIPSITWSMIYCVLGEREVPLLTNLHSLCSLLNVEVKNG
jgi:hypothetical protein